MLNTFLQVSIVRRWMFTALFGLIAAFGYFAWTQLEIDAYPDIADVTVMVITQYPGHAAETVEEQVTIPLERELNGMPGLHVMRSKSTFGLSNITLVFADGVDDYFARQLVRERILQTALPDGAEAELEPLTSPTGEIYRYTLHSSLYTQRELRELQEWVIIPSLREVFGVAEVVSHGGETTQFHAEVDPRQLDRFHLTLEEVIEAVDINNANAGGGRITRGDLSYVVRGIGLVRSLDDLGHIPVATVDGTPVYLRDIATLKRGAMERNGMLGRDHEDDLVQGIVVLLRGVNPSSVLAGIQAKVEHLNTSVLPDDVRLVPYYDRTELIGETVRRVSFTLLQGLALVLLILLLFLGSIRSALIVATVIPVAMLIAFALMYLTNIPANLLSLGALSFGILVDAAIVLVEAIQARREKNPSVTIDAASLQETTYRVAKPIFYSALIIIAAHLPLFAFERIEAKFFTPMAYTIAYALGGALLFSLAVIPGWMLIAFRKPSRMRRNRPLELLKSAYVRTLGRALDRPRWVVVPALVALVLTGIGVQRIGKEFLPYIDEGPLWLQIKLPAGISLERGSQMAAEIRDAVREFEEVTFMVTQLGRNDDGTDPFTPSHIEAMVGLSPYTEWRTFRGKHELIHALDHRLAGIPGIQVGFSQPMIDGVNDKVAGAHSELVVKVFGEDLVQARQIAESIQAQLALVEGAVDLAIDQEPPLPNLQIVIDRAAAARYGIHVARIAELIEVGIGGRPVSEIFLGQRRYDVILRFPEDVRSSPEQIANLLLDTPSGARVALSQVAHITLTTGESTISREMNRRHITLKLNLRGREFSHFHKEAQQRIEENVAFDENQYTVEWGGLFENKERAERRALLILPMVLALIFMLLYAEFRTVRHALLILASLPLAILGGIAALMLRDMSLNVASTVGFIALSGLAVQNGVILLSNINRVKSKPGLSLREAVLLGAAARLRPVLITATTTLFGVLPAAMAFGIGSDIQRPLTTVILGGLLTATLLTLVFLPVVYYLTERRHTEKNTFPDA